MRCKLSPPLMMQPILSMLAELSNKETSLRLLDGVLHGNPTRAREVGKLAIWPDGRSADRHR